MIPCYESSQTTNSSHWIKTGHWEEKMSYGLHHTILLVCHVFFKLQVIWPCSCEAGLVLSDGTVPCWRLCQNTLYPYTVLRTDIQETVTWQFCSSLKQQLSDERFNSTAGWRSKYIPNTTFGIFVLDQLLWWLKLQLSTNWEITTSYLRSLRAQCHIRRPHREQWPHWWFWWLHRVFLRLEMVW